MKSNHFLLTFLLITLHILLGCKGGQDSGSSAENSAPDSLSVKEDTLRGDVTANADIQQVEQANVVCRIYFKTEDMVDEEGNEVKGDIREREEFRTKKAYTFCYDAEAFNKITITGSGKQLSFEVKADDAVVFKKEGFDLEGKVTFTSKDLSISEGARYKVVISQNGQVLFSAKVDSQGCM